jgi:hypothetical protein
MINKNSTTIEVFIKTKELIKKIAEEEGRTMKGLVEWIVNQYDKKRRNK